MYVCLCKAVTDGQIRQLVADGAREWRQIREQTGCGTQCGKCACFGKEVTSQAVLQELALQSADLARAV